MNWFYWWVVLIGSIGCVLSFAGIGVEFEMNGKATRTSVIYAVLFLACSLSAFWAFGQVTR